jgi:signal transduction histidine kinase
VVLLVASAWLLVGVVLGSQTALGMTMQGTPVALAAAVRTSLVNSLPWIPATLVAIALATRFPVTRESWRRTLPLHLAAVPAVAFIANVGVVLGFWWMGGVFQGWAELARQGAFWATLRIHLALLVYLVAVVLTQGWHYVQRTRAQELGVARLESQLARARFQALSEQIRPHFLFNTLHAIGQMWRSGRADEAEEVLDHLGSLFQRVRSSTDRLAIPLAEELSMVEEYLAIERARFRDRLEAEVCATPEARSCVVPPLLLQPLVENAIRHGVSAKTGPGRVRVSAEVKGGRLMLVVSDDGPGMAAPSPSAGSGTGLANTRERLRHAFGDDHDFGIESGPEGGTTVRLEIPAATDPDAAFWG